MKDIFSIFREVSLDVNRNKVGKSKKEAPEYFNLYSDCEGNEYLDDALRGNEQPLEISYEIITEQLNYPLKIIRHKS